MSKPAFLLSMSCEKQISCLYSDPSLCNAAKVAGLSQSVMLHSTGNISAEGKENKKQADHNSIRGTVSSFLFSR
jgi:hypothetical protein